MISRARARQIRWVTWALQVVFWIYFGLVVFEAVHRPSHLAKVLVLSAVVLVYATQGYALLGRRKVEEG
jgi:hypothetical protein